MFLLLISFNSFQYQKYNNNEIGIFKSLPY